MNKTGVEYLDYLWQIFTGCENWHNGVCGGGGQDFWCWAKGLIEGRLKRFYPMGFVPTFHSERFLEPLSVKKPSRIGVGFMGDLFGNWVLEGKYHIMGSLKMEFPDPFLASHLQKHILNIVKACPQHTFLFLTKCPWNLAKLNPWPDNAWVGVSATNPDMALLGINQLSFIQAPIRYLSVEPLLEQMGPIFEPLPKGLKGFMLDWLIIGGKSGSKRFYPPEEWIREIEESADKAGIPVFEKDNLREAWREPPRREFPC